MSEKDGTNNIRNTGRRVSDKHYFSRLLAWAKQKGAGTDTLEVTTDADSKPIYDVSDHKIEFRSN